MPITEIQIKGVRGIRKEITIPLNGKSLLIHGDNGTGKSSIEKSLRWVLRGAEAPTDAQPFSDETSFRRHVLEPADSPKVKVTLTDPGFIEVMPNDISADDPGSAFREACIKGNPFLRRSEILSFLLSRPADRFTYLEAFLDLIAIDDIATKYAAEVERCGSELGNLRTKLQSTLRSLSDRVPESIRPSTANWLEFENSCIKYAISLSLLDPNRSHQWSDLQLAGRKAKELSEGDQLEKARLKLLETQNAINEFMTQHLSKALPKIGELHEESELLKESTSDAPISDLLSHARQHLDTSPTEMCPVCGNTIDRQQILDDLTRRLKNLEAYREAEKEVRLALGVWRTALAHFVSTCAKITTNLRIDSITQLDESLEMPAGFDLFDNIEHETDNAKILAQILAVGADQITKWLTMAARAVAERVNKDMDSLPVPSAVGDLRVFAALIQEASTEHQRLQRIESDVIRLVTRTTIVSKISEALRRARQDVAKDTMASISNTVASYYETIHPTHEPYEATGAPYLKIQRHGRGTAFVQGNFAGQDVSDPNWVYSDGHLDTIGICVFLALRRFRGDQAGDSKLMVLDDVVLSIDLPHARRLINLLKDEFNDHQIIILTHNGLFAHWCSTLLPGMQRMTINTWTLEEGPRLGEYLSAMELVENSLTDQSAKQIALQVMALMDEWLTECRYVYSLAVPAKSGERYTLTEIWEPFASTLKKVGRRLDNDLSGTVTLVDELRDLPAIRNALPAHENEFAREFPRTTMVDIANKCLALVRNLYCPKCRSFAMPVPHRFDPSIIHCDCHCIQYVKPGPTSSWQ